MFKKANILFKSLLLSSVSVFVLVTLCADLLRVDNSLAAVEGLPQPGTLVELSKDFKPPLLEGISFNIEKPTELTFYIDPNDSLTTSQAESQRLIEYFYTALTIPQEYLWVNLSPYESDRVVEKDFVATQMGRDLLAQDYMLKQVSASITNPATPLGRKYWDQFSTIDSRFSIESNAFNKIWIVPDTALVYENGLKAAVADSYLKLMSEADYMAISRQKSVQQSNSKSNLDQILLDLEYEINNGRNFVPLRQIYHSLILASWFKAKFMNTFYKHYINKNKIKGVDTASIASKENIYNLYVESFKKGAYDIIRKEKQDDDYVKKRYFSGGAKLRNNIEITQKSSAIADVFGPNTESYHYDVQTQQSMPKSFRARQLSSTLFPRFKHLAFVFLTMVPLISTMFSLGVGDVSAQTKSEQKQVTVSHKKFSAQAHQAYDEWNGQFRDGLAKFLGLEDKDIAFDTVAAYMREAVATENVDMLKKGYLPIAFATDYANINGARSKMANAYITDLIGFDFYAKIDASSLSEKEKSKLKIGAEQCAMIAVLSDWVFYQMGVKDDNLKIATMPEHVSPLFDFSQDKRILFDVSYKSFDNIKPDQLVPNGDGFDYVGDNTKIDGKVNITKYAHYALWINLAIGLEKLSMYEHAEQALERTFQDTLTEAFDVAHAIKYKSGNLTSINANLKRAIAYTYNHKLMTDNIRYRNLYTTFLLDKVVDRFSIEGNKAKNEANYEQAKELYQNALNVIAKIEKSTDTLSAKDKQVLARDTTYIRLNTLVDEVKSSLIQTQEGCNIMIQRQEDYKNSLRLYKDHVNKNLLVANERLKQMEIDIGFKLSKDDISMLDKHLDIMEIFFDGLDFNLLDEGQKSQIRSLKTKIKETRNKLEKLSSTLGGIDLAKINLQIKPLAANVLSNNLQSWNSIVGLKPVFLNREAKPDAFHQFSVSF